MEKSLARIDPKLFQTIWDEAKKTQPKITRIALYKRVEAIRTRYQKTISTRMASDILAVGMGIDIHKFLKDNEAELTELRRLLNNSNTRLSKGTGREKKKEKEPQIVVNRKIVETFGLPSNLASEANRMSEIYPHLYVFENLMRHVVTSLLEKKYGKDWWTKPDVVPNPITKKVEDRKSKEGVNRWHSERGSHAIFYTDFGDLSSIISKDWKEFETLFPNLRWIQTRLEETELSRNIIAHNNPLPKKECDRLKMFLDDLKKQLGICTVEKS